jgi:hypothetical protein
LLHSNIWWLASKIAGQRAGLASLVGSDLISGIDAVYNPYIYITHKVGVGSFVSEKFQKMTGHDSGLMTTNHQKRLLTVGNRYKHPI